MNSSQTNLLGTFAVSTPSSCSSSPAAIESVTSSSSRIHVDLQHKTIDPDVRPRGTREPDENDINYGFWILLHSESVKNKTYKCKFCHKEMTSAPSRATQHFLDGAGALVCAAKSSKKAKAFYRDIETARNGNKKQKLVHNDKQKKIPNIFTPKAEDKHKVEDAFVSWIACNSLPFAIADSPSFVTFVKEVRNYPYIELPSAKVLGSRALVECSQRTLAERKASLSGVSSIGGWFIADGQVLGRKSLNNSLLMSIFGVLFLRTEDAKKKKKDQEYLTADAVKAMNVVSHYYHKLYVQYV